ncbi:lantibiotic dehydratase [Algoriphagus aquimarinus]|uniref:Lantibiotic dehydratase, C terminus n=1 Tax=Algoriphagus aquimarinus TaxID=237018 RepID=A0A1I1B8P0_9BACT|nr:lantibiotic dehydratase [Algoriphagus aquimarinus]SFB46447.1 Lantibiotic dehydratase, C terminus [Algoriphagus aquimarinus]
MNFLFRSPLFDIDPNDEKDIEENWEQVLEAISISSTSLYQEIVRTAYRNLSPQLKKKVYKYILRGRFRATPFGNFAAVGIGEFSDYPNYNLDLRETSALPSSSNTKKETSSATTSIEYFYLAEECYEKWGRMHFLSYLQEQQHWGLVSLPHTKLLELVKEKLKKHKAITFKEFNGWFEKPEKEFAKEVWGKLLDLGILNSEARVNSSKENWTPSIDLVFNESISIPNSVLITIEDFVQNAGHLFIPSDSPYLDSLKVWFIDKYDDRFPALTLLLKEFEFINSAFLGHSKIRNESESYFDFHLNLASTENVDLKAIIPPKSLEGSIFDLQLVFKLDEQNTILVENTVCNRPFVYFGRFNREKRFFDEEKKIKEAIYQGNSVVYAELRLFETESIGSICHTEQLFEYYITPIKDFSPYAIQLEDIEIGLREDRFILVLKESGKRIIPVVTHPLNGKEISHPLMRLLWELDHANPYRLFTYSYSKYQENKFTPQLNWGEIILQPRKWTVIYSSFNSKDDFNLWAKKNNIPNPILVGYMDRELLLNWNNDVDIEILWAELGKWKKVTLSDPIWIRSTGYRSGKNKPIYPQFVYHHSKPKKEQDIFQFVNSIGRRASDCLYLLFRIPEDECLEFLNYLFCQEVMYVLNKQAIVWYYLVYPSLNDMQVRVRFLNLNQSQKNVLMTLVAKKSDESIFQYEFRDYYPEIKKYGLKDFVKSERIFNLESSFLMNIDGKDSEKALFLDRGQKLELISCLWMTVISRVKLVSPFFEYVKKKIKSSSVSELKNVRNVWASVPTPQDLEVPYLNWMENYTELISSHSYMSTDGKVFPFISNHIHMQINRFFPTERKTMEDLVYYVLYKKLGKAIYSGEKDGD